MTIFVPANTRFRPPASRRSPALVVLVLLVPALAPAATFNWQGGGGDNSWATAANWQQNAAPPSDLYNTNLVFGNTAFALSNVASAYSVRSVSFSADASAYTFSGGPLTIGSGGLIQNAVAAQSFDAPVIFGPGGDWTLGSGAGALTFRGGVDTGIRAYNISAATTTGAGNIINGNFTGDGGFTKTGAGILTLNGSASTFTGGISVAAGILAISDAHSLGGGGIGVNGGEFRVTADVSLALPNRVFVGSEKGGTISAAPGTNLTITGELALYGNVVFGASGQTGTVTVASDSGSMGMGSTINILVNAGTLRASSTSATSVDFFTSNAASTTVAAGATMDLSGRSTPVKNLLGAGSVLTGGTPTTTLTVQTGDFAGVISGPGRLTKTGSGTLTLTGANTYGGVTRISAGTLQIGNGGTTGTLGMGDVINNAALIFNRSDALSAANAISGAGSLTKLGAGTLTLTGTSSYTGATTIGAGTLALHNDPGAATPTAGRLSATSALTINNGGALLLAGSKAVTDRLNNATPVTINGGAQFSTAGSSEGTAPTGAGGAGGAVGMGTLTVTNVTSSLAAVLDFGSSAQNGSTLVFSSLDAVGKGAFVNVLNWTGTAGADNGAPTNDRLLFASDPGFTASDLVSWQFRDDTGTNIGSGAMELAYNGYYELVPAVVPEAGTWVAGGVGVLACAWSLRRRRCDQAG